MDVTQRSFRGALHDIQKTAARETDEWGVESLTFMVECIIRTNFLNCMLNRLIREILHLSGKSQGIPETSGCGNHVISYLRNLFQVKRERGQKI